MGETEKRNFALRDAKGNEIGVFTGKQPRQAALKAANRGIKDIRLRERGTKKVHIFKGERKQVNKPKNAPAWMPAKIWKPVVKKVGVEKLTKV
jgi:Non-histone chromosomal protein MC1